MCPKISNKKGTGNAWFVIGFILLCLNYKKLHVSLFLILTNTQNQY